MVWYDYMNTGIQTITIQRKPLVSLFAKSYF
ncbi:Uncharacterised protein [Streptococcus pneumoniae]|nr:Uncharacterised protein [Streptococcus pneumoniae]CIQ01220.1 Uncharacterised protein [Streptococcus pneumoniae]CIU38265.1 Uncharacterised protein [Streptococcus pneumoniae]CIU87465.1 Uncharacterised protein [Streptococcus pneumoniae]CIW34208.1 Uncharacterised protein [Streptococcus pneumoniae]